MRWAILAILFVLTLVIGVFAAGAMLPLGHIASRTIKLNQSPEAVWSAINNHSDEPNWRPELKSIERLSDVNGHPAWQENYKDGMKLLVEEMESVPAKRLVRKVADSGKMFSGRWEFEITP